MPDEITYFLIIFFVVLFAGAGVVGYFKGQYLAKKWGEAAKRMGLNIRGGTPLEKANIFGTYEGKEVLVRPAYEQRGGRGNKELVRFTVVEVELADPAWSGLKISSKSMVGNLLSFLGGDDQSVGHSGFDDNFRLGGNVSQAAAEALRQPEVQRELEILNSQATRFVVDDEWLEIWIDDRITDPGAIEQLIKDVVEAAVVMDKAVQSSPVGVAQ